VEEEDPAQRHGGTEIHSKDLSQRRRDTEDTK
jgi:hypothetical protein